MSNPSSRKDNILARVSTSPPQESSYQSDRDKYTNAVPIYDTETLCTLTEGVWLSESSVVQDAEDWPAWTDLPFDAVLAMLGGVA
jgi:hypothetical protein